MNCLISFLESADASVGRVEKASFSQQTLMEMVIADVENKEDLFWDPHEPRDIQDWEGLETDNDEVKEIWWNQNSLQGSLHLEWLPATINTFLALGNKLMGTIDLACLPEDVKTFSVRGNAFTGPIDLENMPRKLEKFNVSQNNLSGSLKLGSLPQSLKSLRAAKNDFSGSLELTRLPAEFIDLGVSTNTLLNKTSRHCFCHDTGPRNGGHLRVVWAGHYPILWDVPEMPNTAPAVFGGDERYSYHHCEDAGVGGQKEFERDVRTEMKPSRVCALRVKDAARANRKVEKLTVNLHYPKKNQLSGSLDLMTLSSKIIMLVLCGNSFSSTVDLRCSSTEMIMLDISDNDVFGEVFIPDGLFDRVRVEKTNLIKRRMSMQAMG